MARTTVEAQLAKLRKAKADIEKKEKELLNRTQGSAIAHIVKIAKESSITVEQIAAALKDGKTPKTKRAVTAAKVTRAKVAPKYRNPENAAQTWTGRGKQPLWVQALQQAGALESALIK